MDGIELRKFWIILRTLDNLRTDTSLFTFQENPKPNSVRYLVGYSQVFEGFVGIFSTFKDSNLGGGKGVRIMREAEEEGVKGMKMNLHH